VEEAVWRVVSGLLKDPQTLRVGLEEMMARERRGLRRDPDAQAKTWLSKIAEANRMRAGYQELAAKGLMTFEELGEKLTQLNADKATAEQELADIRKRRETVEGLERDKDTLLKSLADMTPEALDELAPEERHRIYKMMKLRASALLDGGVEVNGIIAPVDEVGVLELAS
jgi:chromosome segregation ATPase